MKLIDIFKERKLNLGSHIKNNDVKGWCDKKEGNYIVELKTDAVYENKRVTEGFLFIHSEEDGLHLDKWKIFKAQ